MTTETITPNDDVTALSDRELLELIYRKMAELDPLVPLIPRALALLDPARSMRKMWGGRSAVQERPAAPVHVGQASADRGPVGA